MTTSRHTVITNNTTYPDGYVVTYDAASNTFVPKAPTGGGGAGPTGPTGPTGSAGINAYSSFSPSFTQPLVGNTVVVTITSNEGWYQTGQIVYIPGGGYYSVSSTGSGTVTLNNLGYTGNGSPGATIPAATMSPGGVAGTTGATGPTGSTGATGATGSGGGGVTSGLAANIPTATGSNTFYAATDTPMLYLDDGYTTSWLGANVRFMPSPPSVASMVTAGTVELVQRGPSIHAATSTATATGSFGLISSGALGSAFIVDLEALWKPPGGTAYPACGCYVATGLTGSDHAYGISHWKNVNSLGMHVEDWFVGGNRNDPAINETSEDNPQPFQIGEIIIRHRLLCDGVNLHYQYSINGYFWDDWYTAAVPGGLNYYGFLLGSYQGGNHLNRALITKLNLSTPDQQTVVGATTASPIEITTQNNHGWSTGDIVAVHGMTGISGGNSGTGNGNFGGGYWIQKTASNKIKLIGTTGSGTWTSGGTVTLIGR